MSNSQTRNAAINLRAFPTQRDLIDKACAVLNKSRSDFIIELACREAENVLLDQRLFMLDDSAFSAFDAAISEEMQPNVALNNLMSKKSSWEK